MEAITICEHEMRLTQDTIRGASLAVSRSQPRGRILIIVENLPVPFDKRVWNEANALTRAGYQVTVICPVGKGYEARSETIDGIRILRHPLPLEGKGPVGYALEYVGTLFWECALALKVAVGPGFDVLQACNPPDTIFMIGWLFKLFGKRFVFDHHDINPELYLAKFGRKDLFYRLMLFLERMTFRTADVSIATNMSYRDIALSRGRMSPDRVFVVRSGPDLRKLQPVAANPELKEGRRYLVGYVGVMGKQEGLTYLLEAARHLVIDKQRKDVLFVLIGSGTEFEDLKAYAHSLGISDAVRFTGRIPDKELIEYLSTADVCVNPDEANEMNDKSTMNKVLEYMALGKPVVQFDLLEGRRSAEDASVYARRNDPLDLGDKILELLEDPARRQHMGSVGRHRIQTQLSWEFSERVLLMAYEAVFPRPHVQKSPQKAHSLGFDVT